MAKQSRLVPVLAILSVLLPGTSFATALQLTDPQRRIILSAFERREMMQPNGLGPAQVESRDCIKSGKQISECNPTVIRGVLMTYRDPSAWAIVMMMDGLKGK